MSEAWFMACRVLFPAAVNIPTPTTPSITSPLARTAYPPKTKIRSCVVTNFNPANNHCLLHMCTSQPFIPHRFLPLGPVPRLPSQGPPLRVVPDLGFGCYVNISHPIQAVAEFLNYDDLTYEAQNHIAPSQPPSADVAPYARGLTRLTPNSISQLKSAKDDYSKSRMRDKPAPASGVKGDGGTGGGGSSLGGGPGVRVRTKGLAPSQLFPDMTAPTDPNVVLACVGEEAVVSEVRVLPVVVLAGPPTTMAVEDEGGIVEEFLQECNLNVSSWVC